MKNLILLLGLFPMFSRAQLSLEDCHAKARANYPLIKQYDLINRSSEYSLSNAGRMYLPQISLTGIAGYIFSDMPSFSPPGSTADEPSKFKFIGLAQINQVIWDGGATKTQKEIIKSSAEVEKANVEVSFQALKERVNQVYFGILLIDERIKTLNNNKEILGRTLNRVSVSKEGGVALQSDADEIQAEKLAIEQKLIELQYSRKAYLEVLSVLIGTQLGAETTLQAPVSLELNNSSENNRPERKVFQEQRKLLTAQSGTNRVQNMPKLGLMGAGVLLAPGINLFNQDFSGLFIAGLSLSWSTQNLYKRSNKK